MRANKIVRFLEARMRSLQVEMDALREEQDATIRSNYLRVVDAACLMQGKHTFPVGGNPCVDRSSRYPTRPTRSV